MMPERQPQAIERFIGLPLHTSAGEEIGTVGRFLTNRVSDLPEWLVLEQGITGGSTLIVPMAGAALEEDERVVSPYASSLIEAQPDIEIDGDVLTIGSEDALNEHFGLGAPHPSGGI
jgi:hypothetical protein